MQCIHLIIKYADISALWHCHTVLYNIETTSKLRYANDGKSNRQRERESFTYPTLNDESKNEIKSSERIKKTRLQQQYILNQIYPYLFKVIHRKRLLKTLLCCSGLLLLFFFSSILLASYICCTKFLLLLVFNFACFFSIHMFILYTLRSYEQFFFGTFFFLFVCVSVCCCCFIYWNQTKSQISFLLFV